MGYRARPEVRGSPGDRPKKLKEGVRLLLTHPEVATRDCPVCEKVHFDQYGRMETDRDGKPRTRPKGTFPPCRYAARGCPKGTPEAQKSLSGKNVAAYYHYLECKAVGDFPKDAIVRRNAGIIRQVEDSVRDERFEMALLKSRM